MRAWPSTGGLRQPNNDRIGSVVLPENLDNTTFRPRVVLIGWLKRAVAQHCREMLQQLVR